ncbi:unnamed protein product [Cuscuta campestris]|uniref:Uncharacterized protein n=1 Tax=Cuscuta campestris TaxID=132261 RepID=A0A484MY84_9ASTE|nr:unnamed protein product [Cuscuta campestris]
MELRFQSLLLLNLFHLLLRITCRTSSRCNSTREMYPALDEKIVTGTALADKVLLRQVSSQEFAEKKHLESFWCVNSATVHHLESICNLLVLYKNPKDG